MSQKTETINTKTEKKNYHESHKKITMIFLICSVSAIRLCSLLMVLVLVHVVLCKPQHTHYDLSNRELQLPADIYSHHKNGITFLP